MICFARRRMRSSRDMIGVDFVVQEALTVRSALGRVGEVTWSKVQGTAMTIARTQGYSLRQLDALAEKLERKADVDELAKVAQSADAAVHEWLAVLARCFQLQDAIAVLKLDRVLDAEPDELDQHRLALSAARQNRRDLIARSTQRLMRQIDAASRSSNATVVMNPFSSRSVVRSRNQVGIAVNTFHSYLEIDDGGQSLEATRWVDAAVGLKDQWVDAGAEGLDTAGRISKQAGSRARSYVDDLSIRLTRGALRRQRKKNPSEEPPATE